MVPPVTTEYPARPGIIVRPGIASRQEAPGLATTNTSAPLTGAIAPPENAFISPMTTCAPCPPAPSFAMAVRSLVAAGDLLPTATTIPAHSTSATIPTRDAMWFPTQPLPATTITFAPSMIGVVPAPATGRPCATMAMSAPPIPAMRRPQPARTRPTPAPATTGTLAQRETHAATVSVSALRSGAAMTGIPARRIRAPIPAAPTPMPARTTTPAPATTVTPSRDAGTRILRDPAATATFARWEIRATTASAGAGRY
jgi:hypothetical protein